MSGLVHIGSAVVDYVYRIDALPSAGTEKTASSYAQVAGGGFNMMVAASRTGMKVVFGGQHRHWTEWRLPARRASPRRASIR